MNKRKLKLTSVMSAVATIAVILLALVIATGCSAKNNGLTVPSSPPVTSSVPLPNGLQPRPTPTPTPEPTPVPTATPYRNPWGEPKEIFSLTDEEKRIYTAYLTSLSTDVFRDVDPVSIAKIFIQCGIEGKANAEYTMFSKEGRDVTKEEYLKMNEKDMESPVETRKEMADVVFGLLYQGKFTDNGDNTGIISFVDAYDNELTFKLLKNAKGVWEVKFNPFG